MNHPIQNFCQCCGMPMGDTDALYGTETDSSKSTDYCCYCYEQGTFLFHGTMAEMIDLCVPHMVEGNPGMTPEQARQMMQQFLPTLKHWKA